MKPDDPFAFSGGTDEERVRARAHLARLAEQRRYVWPIRTPRGLDAVAFAVASSMSHSDVVALLNTEHPDLNDLTPVEWLVEDGAAYVVIAVLARSGSAYRTSDLVDQLVMLLGSELVAYVTSQRDTTSVHWWREGSTEPSLEVTERLAATFHVSFILRSVLPDGAIRGWMQRRNPRTQGLAPARLLHDGLTTVFTILAAARYVAARPELHPGVTMHDVLTRARQLWAEPSATEWLHGSNYRYLDGARPIDLVHLGRGQEVLDALDGVEQGGMG